MIAGGLFVVYSVSLQNTNDSRGLFVVYSMSLQDTNDSRGAVCYVFRVSAGRQ